MRLAILPERPHLGPMKPVSSARTTQTILPTGQLQLTIENDMVRGVTPAMLRRWFETLGLTMTCGGMSFPRCLPWHPRDPIQWELAARPAAGGNGQGARFRIVEAFATDPACYVDSTEQVEKLDEEGIYLVRRHGHRRADAQGRGGQHARAHAARPPCGTLTPQASASPARGCIAPRPGGGRARRRRGARCSQ